jgi:anti-sigma factor ChrR (cupin superfamily)
VEQWLAELSASDPAIQTEASAVLEAATLAMAALTPLARPSAALKAKVMERIRHTPQASPARQAPPVFSLVRASEKEEWIQLPEPGASVKLLSLNEKEGYAVVMGKLGPGAHYPAHTHIGPEEVYVVSGDLKIGGDYLGAGDFHHAAAGSTHEINHSEKGCVIIAVLTVADLQAQMAPTQ